MPTLFDVVAVNIKTNVKRPLATDKTEREAEAIIKMAVFRRGVDEEFYTAIPVSERVKQCAANLRRSQSRGDW